MEGINYVNVIEIGPVVVEILGVKNSELVVPVNNTLVCHTVDTRPCVLICLASKAEMMKNILKSC